MINGGLTLQLVGNKHEEDSYGVKGALPVYLGCEIKL